MREKAFHHGDRGRNEPWRLNFLALRKEVVIRARLSVQRGQRGWAVTLITVRVRRTREAKCVT